MVEGYIAEVAQEATGLGLEVETRARIGLHTLAAWGELDGQVVRVDATWQGLREQSYVVLQSRFDPELDLGLHVRRTMLSLGTGIAVDFPGFVDEHHVAGDDPARVRALLAPDLCRIIAAVSELGSDVDIDDTRAAVREPMGFTDLAPTLRALTRITAAISDRMSTLPPAAPLAAAAETWRAYARREGLGLRASPLEMSGHLVTAKTARTGLSTYVTDVAVRLEEPLELGIALRPARRLELLWEIFAGSDVQVGDAPFDRAFTIAARDPAMASVVLDADVRERIMALRREGDVHLADHGMTLRTTHVEEVPAAIDRMRGTLEAALRNARSAVRRGPYR